MDSYTLYNAESDFPLVITAEHGGNNWPVELKSPDFPAGWQQDHSCYDLGMAELAKSLSDRLGCPALIGNYTRLLVDLNREESDNDLIATQSDGFVFPDNAVLSEPDRQQRTERYYRPYQQKLDELLQKPRVMLSLHSFTKRLRSATTDRPWDIGILFVKENPFSDYLLQGFQKQNDICAAANEPYDLRKVNGGTVRFHAEKRGLENAELEIRNDWFDDMNKGVAFWSERLVPILQDYFKK